MFIEKQCFRPGCDNRQFRLVRSVGVREGETHVQLTCTQCGAAEALLEYAPGWSPEELAARQSEAAETLEAPRPTRPETL